jgi:probable rRNA maturation factor
VRQLNAEYRERDETTDVLSFAMHDDDDEWVAGFDPLPIRPTGIDPPPIAAEPEQLLGDVVISVEQAQRQTPDQLEDELLRLMVHGYAHLHGHDHQRAAELKQMSAAEAHVLEHFGLEGGLIERSQ